MNGLDRVLFVGHTTILGGAELSLARFLRSEAGAGSSLVLLSPQSAADWHLPASVRVAQTVGTAGQSGIRSIVSQLARLIDSLDPDVVVANSFSAAQYLAFVPKKGRRYVYFLRQEALPDGLPMSKTVLNRAFVLHRFDHFFVNSDWTASTLPRSIDRRRVLISRPISGVRTEPVRGEAFATDTLRMLTLSRLSPWKGVHTAIEALLMVNDETPSAANLTVAGGDLFSEAGYSARLHDLARGANVVFVGHVSETRPLLRDADILLCLSTTPEPFGQVIIQGMANECVVIATDHGGPREIIQHGVDGFLVPPDDPVAVARVVSSLRKDSSLARQVAAAALQRAREFEDTVTIPQFAAALSATLTGVRR